jgi:hypothetical protein
MGEMVKKVVGGGSEALTEGWRFAGGGGGRSGKEEMYCRRARRRIVSTSESG